MKPDKERIQAKINYLQDELENLRSYFFVTETYHYLQQQLDTQLCLLKEIEVRERFEAIDSAE